MRRFPLYTHSQIVYSQHFIKGYTKSDGGYVIIDKNIHLPIASDKVALIMNRIQIIKR
ncbi:hypothetical protein [Flavobacterium sp.]|uniref:hypothetical protein n=1 Tax=Flavobacterium sp. TaxID=239 RepID=UPI003D1519A0